MFLKGILSIAGYSGLFKLISQGKSTIIVESLEDKKRMPAYASSKISALEDIAIFTDEKEVALKDVFKIIHKQQNGGPALHSKFTDDELKKFFVEILPDYDRKKVYVSDMKKVINWYNILQKHDLITFEEEPEKKDETTEEVEKAEETADNK
ncbi:MAG: DUF5606 domain-containing protein [Bacteroidia bacterium]|nr:DUF5606 domain-containing protein [Bacteroidia bacterium]